MTPTTQTLLTAALEAHDARHTDPTSARGALDALTQHLGAVEDALPPQARILILLRRGPQRLAAISEGIGKPRSATVRALVALCDAGKIERLPEGVYGLPGSGLTDMPRRGMRRRKTQTLALVTAYLEAQGRATFSQIRAAVVASDGKTAPSMVSHALTKLVRAGVVTSPSRGVWVWKDALPIPY